MHMKFTDACTMVTVAVDCGGGGNDDNRLGGYRLLYPQDLHAPYQIRAQNPQTNK